MLPKQALAHLLVQPILTSLTLAQTAHLPPNTEGVQGDIMDEEGIIKKRDKQIHY